MNYFELFELPVRFTLDLDDLGLRFRELQKSVHPDKFAAAPEAERLMALQRSAQINDGYQVLKTPLSRAKHLMELHGHPLTGEQTFTNPTFLMQQMELREELEELREKADATAFEQYEGRINSTVLDYFQRIGAGLDQQPPQDLEGLAELIREVKFLLKIKQELERIEESLFEL